MQLFIDGLKGQFNSLNIVLSLLIISWLLFLKNKRMAKVIFISAFILFYFFSTDYLPRSLASMLERKYQPLKKVDTLPLNRDQFIIIHVLGGGYTLDDRMQEVLQLTQESLGRLTEGIRILNELDSSRLVCSGYASSGAKSLGTVFKGAALSLGVDSTRITILDKPSTTVEEARELATRYPTGTQLILVTSAIHMSRAIVIFRQAGFDPIAAPANFLVKEDDNPYHFGLWPAVENLRIMDAVIREFMGMMKVKLSRNDS
jgi:uncharacterized SAM-binding protein YcdF (DUF218 family)